MMFADGASMAGTMRSRGWAGARAGAAGAEAFGADAAELGALEWRVVALARREADRFGRAAIAEAGALGRLFARLTGMRGVARLADERLEALRRFVCLARRGDLRMAAAAATLDALGFSTGAIHAVTAAATR